MKRFYKINDKLYPSVTTIIHSILRRYELEQWRGRIGNEKADEILEWTSDFGFTFHKICEDYINHCLISEFPEYTLQTFPILDYTDRQDWQFILKKMLVLFDDFLNKYVLDIWEVEKIVYSEKYQYAGTLDLLVTMADNTLTLIDIKTSNQIHKEFLLQLAAYKYAYQEMTGKRIKKLLILNIPRSDNPKIKTYELQNPKLAFDLFKSCLFIFKNFENLK